MAEKNTPLINALLEQVGQHPDFETWRQKGKLPTKFVKSLCDVFKIDPRFIGQPGRFYSSASTLVEYIYKSWFAVQHRLQRQLERQTRWQEMLNSDAELVQAANCSLDTISTKASEILAAVRSSDEDSSPPKGKKGGKTKKLKDSHGTRSLSNFLFEAYRETEDILIRCAISYLLKNGCKISDKEEDTNKFAKRRRKVEIRVSRIQEQLVSRMPKGKDLTGAHFLKTLAIATTTVPQDQAEARFWQDSLLQKSKDMPFPFAYGSTEDMTWVKNETTRRICVYFNGLSEHVFEVYCDQRQLHWFKRFLEDQQTKRDSKNQHSTSLSTLRSGHIVWQKKESKGDPWNAYRLTLHCCVDTCLWTTEGTEQVRQEKAAEITKTLARMKEKGDLNEKQEASVKRKQSTLDRISNHFPRPSKPLYQGQSHILVGVSLGLDKPATAAVVDLSTGKTLTYRSVRQLLGDDYTLLNRQRQQQQRNSHQRHKAQKRAAPNSFGESELGQYVDRLLAQALVRLAQAYQADSIVLPKMGDMRENIQSEIKARTEQKCPGYIEGQQKYAKQYRVSVHKWSYGRLIESIQSLAVKVGIAIEEGQQPVRGSPQEKARELAIAAYQSRNLRDY